MPDAVIALARIFIVALFLWSGFGKITNPAGLTGMLTAKGFPQPMLFAYLAGLAELGLGILILIGFKTRAAALALAAFTIVTVFLGHNFWQMTGDAYRNNLIQALKNLSIVGGLLMLAATGPGRYSADKG
ncbi:MAG TPA: DoxX family protein [Enterovirga sp.]|jgi:putative oxidoreductase